MHRKAFSQSVFRLSVGAGNNVRVAIGGNENLLGRITQFSDTLS